jgi:phage tail sheath protein FI
MLGIAGNDRHPVGLELLLRQDEVAIVAIPDFDATWVETEDRYDPADLLPDPCFSRCLSRRDSLAAGAAGTALVTSQSRLFDDATLLWAQQYLVERLLRLRWRWFGILAPPPGLTADQAIDWRKRLVGKAPDWDVAALYWPWTLAQDSPGAPVRTCSPVGSVAGIFAQVDIARGPHAAPANRRIEGIVGLDRPVGDAENALAYEAGVNVLRAFPGRGIQLWGVRTLLWQSRESRSDPLAFVNARRCLSAIARSCEVIGQPIVFEPNNTLQRIKLHQLLTDYLLRVFRQGALMGDLPQDAFFVAIDPAEQAPEGQLVCKIGVALAAPAEFIVFRIGRRDGVIEGEVQS